jgi:hypothetical protein
VDTIAYAIKRKIKAGAYRPLGALTIRIPKASGGERVVSVFPIPDTAVGSWLHERLATKYDSCFSDAVFGYRPSRPRGVAEAVTYVSRILDGWPRTYALSYDFKAFFDSVDHDYVLRAARDLVGVKRKRLQLLESILRTPRAATSEDFALGALSAPERGLPPGNSASLFLANVTLLELDRAFEKARLEFARFADDVIVLCRDRAEVDSAKAIFLAYSGRAGLTVNTRKSPGLELVSDEHDEPSVPSVEFLGRRIGRGFIGLSRGSKDKIRHATRRIIARHLHAHGSHEQDPLDALYRCVRALARRLYGRGVPAVEVERVLEGGKLRLAPDGALRQLLYPRGAGMADLRSLDGWLMDEVRSAMRSRGLEPWQLQFKIPSFFLAGRYAQIHASRRGCQ